MSNFNYILYYPDKKKNIKVKYENILDELLYNNAIIPKISKETPQVYIDELRDRISKIQYKIPLYDIYDNEIYLIKRDNVFDYVKLKNMRLINNSLLEYFKLSTDDKHKKIKQFFNNFDYNVLHQTYINVSYNYSNLVGKDLTNHIKKSYIPYIPHLKPYYTRSEIINLALNMKLIKESDIYYTKEKVSQLAKKVTMYDITSDQLLKHQDYIIKNNGIDMVKFYSFLGSTYINNYLRKIDNYEVRNSYYELFIIQLNKLVTNAPVTNDKEFYVYRFLNDDDFLQDTKIGTSFLEEGFLSSTRNPFYYDGKNNTFGNYLMKIKIPKRTNGYLFIETLSMFGSEEEIIFRPNSKFKLLSKDKNATYYHTNDNYQNTIKTIYEFEYIPSKNKIEFNNYLPENKIILPNPLQLKLLSSNTLKGKINDFTEEHTNNYNQFLITENNKTYVFKCDWYNSLTSYRKFFNFKTKKGFFIYLQNYETGKIEYFVEIGNKIVVNHFNKYMSLGDSITDELILKFTSYFSFIFNINECEIYPNYNDFGNIKFDNTKYSQYEKLSLPLKYTFRYNHDIKNVITQMINNKTYKRFNSSFIVPKFKIYQFREMKNMKINDVIKKDDSNRFFELSQNSKSVNLLDFYLYILNNYFFYINELETLLIKKFKYNSPFINNYYKFDSFSYLRNENLIDSIFQPNDDNELGDIEGIGEELDIERTRK